MWPVGDSWQGSLSLTGMKKARSTYDKKQQLQTGYDTHLHKHAHSRTSGASCLTLSLPLFASALRTAHNARALSQFDSLTLRSRAANVTRSPHTLKQTHTHRCTRFTLSTVSATLRISMCAFLVFIFKTNAIYYFVLFC